MGESSYLAAFIAISALATFATRTLVVVFAQLKQLAQPVKGALQARGTTTRTTAANAAAAMPRERFKASVTSRQGSVVV